MRPKYFPKKSKVFHREFDFLIILIKSSEDETAVESFDKQMENYKNVPCSACIVQAGDKNPQLEKDLSSKYGITKVFYGWE
jgi:hypothetical protein